MVVVLFIFKLQLIKHFLLLKQWHATTRTSACILQNNLSRRLGDLGPNLVTLGLDQN